MLLALFSQFDRKEDRYDRVFCPSLVSKVGFNLAAQGETNSTWFESLAHLVPDLSHLFMSYCISTLPGQKYFSR